MGDRTSCSLEIGGIVHADDLPSLANAIDDEFPQEGDALEILQSGDPNNCFSFDEVNYGTMPHGVAEALKRLKLSYSWRNEPGGGYGSRIVFHDAASGEEASYATAEDEIMLSIATAEDPAKVARAKAWSVFQNTLTLTVLHSAHEKIAMLKSLSAKAFLHRAPEPRPGSKPESKPEPELKPEQNILPDADA